MSADYAFIRSINVVEVRIVLAGGYGLHPRHRRGHNRKNRSTFHKQAKKVKLSIGVAKTGRGEVLSR